MHFIDQTLPGDVLAFDNTDDVTTHVGRSPGRHPHRAALSEVDRWTRLLASRLLRSRLRFGGEIVATGEVLVDMLPLLQPQAASMRQCAPIRTAPPAERALGFFDGHYQADLVSKLPLFSRPAQ